MNQFRGRDIEAFLRAVDRHLTGPIEIRIIGGAAAVLSFGLQSATMDIDLKSITAADIDSQAGAAHFESACTAARAETGLDIPVSVVGIWEAPWEFESRFSQALSGSLVKLRILVPERYDWAFMKIVRLDEKDIQHIKEVHALTTFESRVFLDRFMREMTHVQPADGVARRFLTMMEELFGADEADKMEKEIRKLPEWKNI